MSHVLRSLQSSRRLLVLLLVGAIAVFQAPTASATVVRYATSLGVVDVRLYDTATPLTVANFLNYSTSNRYNGSFIHRGATNFVVQGGGFTFTPPTTVNNVPTDPPVQNEFGISNQRGTIAMAKTAAGPNSATSQWFFNWKDNSGTPPLGLDHQNGGFTVFGRVVGSGMSVVDAINALPKVDLDQSDPGTFDEVPLRGTSAQPLAERLIFVNTVNTLNIPAGDYNFDGKVDGADLAVWKADFGSATRAEADGNGDGRVDGADYLVWQRTAGQNFGAPTAGAASAVPEPAAATMVFFASASLAIYHRIKRRSTRRQPHHGGDIPLLSPSH